MIVLYLSVLYLLVGHINLCELCLKRYRRRNVKIKRGFEAEPSMDPNHEVSEVSDAGMFNSIVRNTPSCRLPF